MKKTITLGVCFFLLLLTGHPVHAAPPYWQYLPLVVLEPCTKPLTFMAFGDSITSCYFDTFQINFPNCGYPLRIRDKLVASHNVGFSFYNNGIGGEGTDGGLTRFQATIDEPGLYCVDPNGLTGDCFYPPASSNRKADLVIILEGINDLGSGTPYAIIDADLRGMVMTAQQNNLQVILVSIPPVTSKGGEDRTAQAQRISEFNQFYIPGIVNDFKIDLADVYNAFIGYPDWENALIVSDGLHPNDLGFEVMANVIYQAIAPRLNGEGCYQ